jgi:hypothetical protein
LCIYLGAPLKELTGTDDELGRNLLNLRGCLMNSRHRFLVNIVGDLCVESGGRVWTEPPGMFKAVKLPNGKTKGANRRPDVACIDSASLAKELIDGTVRNTSLAAYVARPAALREPLHAVLEAEKDKLKHYADMPEGWTLVPAAMGTQLEIGPLFHVYLLALATRAATRANGGKPPLQRDIDAKYFNARNRVSMAAVRGMAKQVIGAINNAPHPALKDVAAYKHSRWSDPEPFACTCGDEADCVCMGLWTWEAGS